jgi:excisionase family DNA binding protein
MARMRYPQQALELLKKEDPGTQVTVNFIRSLAKSGQIPTVKIGRRRLINYDKFLEYLADPPEVQSIDNRGGSIRPVPSRLAR